MTNEEGVTFIYTGLGKCLFRTGVSSSRVDLSSRNYIFILSFFVGPTLLLEHYISSLLFFYGADFSSGIF